MGGDTAHVKATSGFIIVECRTYRLTEGWIPVTLKSENTAIDWNRRLGWVRAPRVRDRKAGAMKPSDTGYLGLCIAYLRQIDRLLGLKHGIYTLGWDNDLTLVSKYERRILSIEYYHVDLIAECTKAVNHMGSGSLIPLRPVQLQEREPYPFACIAFRARMATALATGIQLLLDIII